MYSETNYPMVHIIPLKQELKVSYTGGKGRFKTFLNGFFGFYTNELGLNSGNKNIRFRWEHLINVGKIIWHT